MSNGKKRGYEYQIKAISSLTKLLFINSFIYFIFSDMTQSLNLGVVNNLCILIKDFIDFNYDAKSFCFINFLMISFITIKILFKIRIPVFLIFLLLFMLRYDPNLARTFKGITYTIRFYTIECVNIRYLNYLFIHHKYGIENLNYTVNFMLLFYLFLNNRRCKSLGIECDEQERNVMTKKTYYNDSSLTNNTREERFNKHKSMLDLNNNQEKEKIRIFSDFDKERAYRLHYIDPFAIVIDEDGIEKEAWMYAREYEEDKRKEELKFKEEQDYFNSQRSYDHDSNDDYGWF